MAKKYSPTEFLKEKKLREIPVEKEVLAKFKDALSNHLPPTPDDDPESNYSACVKGVLNDTFYKGKNKIAQRKGVKTDLNIFADNTTSSSPIVLIEMKRPSEKNDMLTQKDLNRKALHELILYYLTELEGPNHNNAIRYLIASNGYDWFVFEETIFRRLFTSKNFKQEYKKVNPNEPKLYKESTKEFYAYVAKEIEVKGLTDEMAYIYFSLKEWDKISNQKLSNICKLLSPYFLLGKHRRDANDMNEDFYKELLYVIGLEEKNLKGNVTIQRLPKERREQGSLLESTLSWLVAHDELSAEKRYDAALELVLTWVNRLLFIKLVESQVISFNSWEEPEKHRFFSEDKIQSFRHIDDLFFKVLALPKEKRDEDVKKVFNEVPYLNSKLFECTNLERQLNTKISFLKMTNIKPYKDTVIVDGGGKRIKEPLSNINYLIEFLASYNFGEAREDDTRELINASVLGKIFEKINGYKDGAVFTPSSVTNFICKETLERATLDKLNAQLGCQCHTLMELKGHIQSDRLRQASDAINELRVCDPAVGSGHFLISALNRLVAIKAELGVLLDEKDQPLSLSYNIAVNEDDELEVKRGNQHFVYKKDINELTRIQKALFREKTAIIEHCLFGVDINPKSVDICQLRLWIELLKNAYYENESPDSLVTLPNIDINIKQGDSLLHSLPLDADITDILKRKYISISTYKEVNTNYKAANKSRRKEYDQILKSIRQILHYYAHSKNDRLYKRKEKLSAQLSELGFIGYVNPLFHHEEITDERIQEKVDKIATDLEKVTAQIKERERIYDNAFEWRYMFPDVLADDGSYEGFDCIIGNPPYIQLQSMRQVTDEYEKKGYASFTRMGDICVLFYEWCMSLLRKGGYLTFITTNSWMRADYGKKLQKFFESSDVNPMMLIDFFTFQVFRNVTIRTNIMMLQKAENRNRLMCCTVKDNKSFKLKDVGKFYEKNKKGYSFIGRTPWVFIDEEKETFINNIREKGEPLTNWNLNINRGIITGCNDAFWISTEQYQKMVSSDERCKEILVPHLRGRNIKPYQISWEGYYLINSHNGLKEEKLNPVDIKDYPPVKKHLESHYDRLEARGDKGDTPYNLRNCAYLKDFTKKKIIYPIQTNAPAFYLDTDSYYINDKAFMIVGHHLAYLTAFFNSVLFRYCFFEIFPPIQGGNRELREIIFKQIPVKDVTDEEDAEYERRIMEIQQMKRAGLSTRGKEHELNIMILAHYGITDQEQQNLLFTFQEL
ncbi:MAG: Eco57I restriction-modification methylase domain-containing protein [Bacteroidaceae bacterium]|nr:Eco57I restriction-modification methylase domain-containing protein [Bacteroidaceae bacterium]